MQVFVIEATQYGDTKIIQLFSTEELAKKALNKFQPKGLANVSNELGHSIPSYQIAPHDLDQHIPEHEEFYFGVRIYCDTWTYVIEDIIGVCDDEYDEQEYSVWDNDDEKFILFRAQSADEAVRIIKEHIDGFKQQPKIQELSQEIKKIMKKHSLSPGEFLLKVTSFVNND